MKPTIPSMDATLESIAQTDCFQPKSLALGENKKETDS
jgi:hypothetical protein